MVGAEKRCAGKMEDGRSFGSCTAFEFVDIEFADVSREVLPSAVEMEAAFGHFGDSLVFGPVLNNDSIDGAHCPGTVGTMFTVDEDGSPVGVGYDLKEANGLAVSKAPGECRYMHIVHSCALKVFGVGVKRAQVDHGSDAQRG